MKVLLLLLEQAPTATTGQKKRGSTEESSDFERGESIHTNTINTMTYSKTAGTVLQSSNHNNNTGSSLIKMMPMKQGTEDDIPEEHTSQHREDDSQ